MSNLPPEHQSRLDRELDEGEQIRWVSQPQYRLLRRRSIANWLGLGLVALFFSCFFLLMGWIASITPEPERQDEPWTFFVAVGVTLALWCVSYIFFAWWARSVSKSTIYALTNKRAIIIITVHRDGSITERDYRGDELIHLARKEYKDGSGTLTFESARGAGHTSQTASRHRFQAIKCVIEVERMLREQFGES